MSLARYPSGLRTYIFVYARPRSHARSLGYARPLGWARQLGYARPPLASRLRPRVSAKPLLLGCGLASRLWPYFSGIIA